MEPQSPYSNQSEGSNQYTPSFGQTPPSTPPIQQNFQAPPPIHHPNPNPLSHPAHVGDKIEQIIMLSYFCVAALLGFRFALGLFGARVSPFVNFIHDISIPFMIPFEGMFGATPRAGYYSIEFEALVAIIVYALVFFGLGRLVKILFK